MKRTYLSWLIASAAVLIVLLIPDNAPPGQQNMSMACFGSDCFTVELALTPEQQARGLMGRQSLYPEAGMLFVFQEEGVYPFWMKDTLIPLDMIWMDSNKTVVFIKNDAQPCGMVCPSVNPGVPAKYVLEVNAGTADRIGLHAGDRMELSPVSCCGLPAIRQESL